MKRKEWREGKNENELTHKYGDGATDFFSLLLLLLLNKCGLDVTGLFLAVITVECCGYYIGWSQWKM